MKLGELMMAYGATPGAYNLFVEVRGYGKHGGEIFKDYADEWFASDVKATHSDCVLLQARLAKQSPMRGFDPCGCHCRWRTDTGMSCEAIIANARLRTLRSLMPMAMDHVTEGRTAGTKEIRRETVRCRRAIARAVSSFGYFSSLPPTHPPCFLTS